MEEPKPGQRYQHFLGEEKLYEIVNVARDCDDPKKKIVIYKSLYEGEFPVGTIWARRLEEFVGDKEFEDGKKIKRFKLVGGKR
jgi:hypothetical protein